MDKIVQAYQFAASCDGLQPLGFLIEAGLAKVWRSLGTSLLGLAFKKVARFHFQDLNHFVCHSLRG